MAKTKAELESHCARYHQLAGQMRESHQAGDISKAVELAASAWPFIDGMMQYERRFAEREDHARIECIDYVLRYAPLMFKQTLLDDLSQLLKSQRRIDKNSSADLAGELESARVRMSDAHHLWSHLESEVEGRQDELRRLLGGDQDNWRWMAETWEQMGLISRRSEGGSYRLRFVTRMTDLMRAKCPACGVTGKAAKEKLLDERSCPKCRTKVHFVILANPE
jgi:hypothetical protein